MASLYAQYLTERTNDAIIETDEGFVTYRFLNDKQCYIVDIFVKPEHRRSRVASRLADEVTQAARENGCSELVSTVVPSANGSTNSLKAVLSYGFKLDSATNNVICLTKEI
jgi:ribosomal protein S18 acetylase RimI-like enzyme